ncbi:PEBP-like protein [Xylariaceae sp. FL0255]|nr:PEBP-like protein [Xylariaceae sp. FL0255]
MRSSSLAALTAAASGVLAFTPPGFEPSSKTNLLVTYGSVAALNGTVVAKAAVASAPTLATENKLDGTSFLVIMIDRDIPTDHPPVVSTLLHWMQPGFTQSCPSTQNTTTGALSDYILSPSEAAYAEYLSPSPPAYVPLSHQYTQVLVDTSAATDSQLATLMTAAKNRTAFDVKATLTQAGLIEKVVAGNWFNVTNPGPAQPPPNTTTSGSTSATNTATPPAQGDAMPREVNGLIMIAMAAVMYFAL